MATAKGENAYQAQKLRFEQELVRLNEALKDGLFSAGHNSPWWMRLTRHCSCVPGVWLKCIRKAG
jgi:hypothetical protein